MPLPGVSNPIVAIETSDYRGPVYNFAVELEESFQVASAIVHNCRCVVVTAFIPAELEKYLAGVGHDFAALKDDIHDYMGNRKFDGGVGVRHAKRFVDDVFAERHLGEHARTGRFDISGSARELTRRLNDRGSYFPNLVQPRAPTIRW
jgi:hypothetical protein